MLPACRRIAPGLLLALWLSAAAVAVPLRVATFNIELGLEASGEVGHDAVADVLARIDADVVALQEVRSQDVPSNIGDLAATLGYSHQYVGELGPLDNNNRNVFLSRFPITASTSITSPAGAVDVTRTAPAIVVDVPGTAADPTIITLHLKCCLDPDDSFRRAVELDRVVDYLVTNSLDSTDNVIVLGDFNLLGSSTTYNSLPEEVPSSYDLGADINFPVAYSPEPAFYFTFLPLGRLDAYQADGVTDTTQGSSAVLDHILASPALTSRPFAVEVYNSAFEGSFSGLPKSGSPPPSGTSNNASDHYAIFADFELDSSPPLALSLSAGTVAESDPPGTSVLTVTLPETPGPGESVTVNVSSSDPGEASTAQPSLVFTTGVTSLDVDVVPQEDGLVDGSQAVVFTAVAAGFLDGTANLTVTDATDTFYTLSSPDATIVEDFDQFDGTSDPARWPLSSSSWQGVDDGSSSTAGNYAYGSLADPSLGVLLDAAAMTATGTYLNSTGGIIRAVQVGYDAEQWRAALGGRADTWTVELIIDGSPTALPPLTFTADDSLPGGPVGGGNTTALSAIVSGLSIPDGASFDLRFTATPGEGGGTQPDDVFLNEFHYDNVGADTGEFVEVVVGPGYAGSLADLSVVLYNGNGGGEYGTHTLDTFDPGTTTASGHRLFSKFISGIQNGAPDGIAIVSGSSVLHFLSYEGSFTADDGPAAGMTSTDIGVAQDPVPAAGEQSLGLSGSGGSASDFTWTRFTGNYTRGAVNEGQTLLAPAGAPGIALDNITVTLIPVTDTDGDGDPDATDPDDDGDGITDEDEATLGTNPLLVDSDNNGINDGEEDFDLDGQSNFSELSVTLTDPLDPQSRFVVRASPVPGDPNAVRLSYPTVAGRDYLVERIQSDGVWTVLPPALPGDGAAAERDLPGGPLPGASKFRVVVTLP